MFDYVNRLQLALGDTARRTGMKIVAGVILGVGFGFLVAALWSWLATELGWGAALASLAIGGGLVALGLLVLMMAAHRRHAMPTSEDLKREVEARVSLAADAAVARAKAEAAHAADMAQAKVQSLMDEAGFRATRLARDTEQRVFGMVRDTADSVGLSEANLQAAKDGVSAARETVRDAAAATSRAANSNAGSMAKLVGAFALGVTLAAKLVERRGDHAARHDDDDLM